MKKDAKGGKLLPWVGLAAAGLVIALLALVAKAALPFVIGVVCGATAYHFWDK